MSKAEHIIVEKELIFVYNAKSDLFSKMTDVAHKALSPNTYACNLCQVSYGHFTIHREWADFIKSLPYHISFQYKNEWKELGLEMGFPLVLLKQGEKIRIVVSPEELNIVQSPKELINLLIGKLEELR